MIRTIERDIPVGQAIKEPLQGCCITPPTFPVQELACMTIQSVPDPEFPPFFWRKCHISSRSSTIAFPVGVGFSQWSVAYRRIHFNTELAQTPNIFPKAFIEMP
jgi:hypothetical protein